MTNAICEEISAETFQPRYKLMTGSGLTLTLSIQALGYEDLLEN